MGKKEEISDIISDEAYDDPKFKRGLLLKLQKANIKITKVDRKHKRTWGEHIELVNPKAVDSHYNHLIDATAETYDQYGAPYCQDCEMPINAFSSEDGEKKALDRVDRMREEGKNVRRD